MKNELEFGPYFSVLLYQKRQACSLLIINRGLVCVRPDFHTGFFFFTGVGRTAPDPGATVTLDGVQVPLGKGVHTNIDDTSLLYNEYPLVVISLVIILIITLPNNPAFFLLFHNNSLDIEVNCECVGFIALL